MKMAYDLRKAPGRRGQHLGKQLVPFFRNFLDLCGNQISGAPTPSTRRRSDDCVCSMAWRFKSTG